MAGALRKRRKVATTSTSSVLTFKCTSSQTSYDLPFGKQVEKDCRQGGYSYKSRRKRQIRTVLPLELHGAERQSPEGIPVEKDQRGE